MTTEKAPETIELIIKRATERGYRVGHFGLGRDNRFCVTFCLGDRDTSYYAFTTHSYDYDAYQCFKQGFEKIGTEACYTSDDPIKIREAVRSSMNKKEEKVEKSDNAFDSLLDL